MATEVKSTGKKILVGQDLANQLFFLEVVNALFFFSLAFGTDFRVGKAEVSIGRILISGPLRSLSRPLLYRAGGNPISHYHRSYSGRQVDYQPIA